MSLKIYIHIGFFRLESSVNNLHSTLGSFMSVEEEILMIMQYFYVPLCFLLYFVQISIV